MFRFCFDFFDDRTYADVPMFRRAHSRAPLQKALFCVNGTYAVTGSLRDIRRIRSPYAIRILGQS